jgi:hypothetical protein
MNARRSAPAAAVAAVLLLVLSATAAGSQPVKTRFVDDFDLVVTSCGFPVLLELRGIAYEHAWFDENGELLRFSFTPAGRPYRVALTNVGTGTAITLTIPGSIFFELQPDGGFTGITSGPFLLLYRPESITLPLVPWLYYFAGHRVLTVAGDGTRTVTWYGRFVDLCAELAR